MDWSGVLLVWSAPFRNWCIGAQRHRQGKQLSLHRVAESADEANTHAQGTLGTQQPQDDAACVRTAELESELREASES